jgi:hypothetical protein
MYCEMLSKLIKQKYKINLKINTLNREKINLSKIEFN